jgi:branched-chain amino acid transport system substrate-binding protein
MSSMHRVAAMVVALGLVAAACAEDSNTSDTTTAPAGTEAPSGTEVPSGTGAPSGTEAPSGTDAVSEDEVNAWALEYTGGTAGAATGEPIKIGYVNQNETVPEATIGVEAAIE